MKFYQLCAVGRTQFLEDENKIYSKKVFSSKESAESYVDEFHKIVCTPRGKCDFGYLIKETVSISILELESVD